MLLNQFLVFQTALVAAPLGEIIHVPTDAPTIQACIDAAVNGDECVVAPGTYNELINFNGKAIILRTPGAITGALHVVGFATRVRSGNNARHFLCGDAICVQPYEL